MTIKEAINYIESTQDATIKGGKVIENNAGEFDLFKDMGMSPLGSADSKLYEAYELLKKEGILY